MSKHYIYQLTGGKMLVYRDGWIGVEQTGYPLPDCKLELAGRTIVGQSDIMRTLLGYDIEDAGSFVAKVSKLNPMTYDDFKKFVVENNIGGESPDWIKAMVENPTLTHNQARFKYMLPSACVEPNCALPSDEDLVEEYGDILGYDWNVRRNISNWRFQNNMILFTGCREVTDKLVDFVRDIVAICMTSTERSKYRYISAITLSNGNGAIMLEDSYIGNCDIAYLYKSVTGVDLNAGRIICKVDGEEAHAKYVTSNDILKHRRIPELNGVVKRYAI